MSLGWFDYGFWNPLVLRLAPTTGERVIPRWVFEAVPPVKRDGYTIEMMINEVVASRHLKTSVRVMKGVTHRTKRDKFGLVKGWQLTWKCRPPPGRRRGGALPRLRSADRSRGDSGRPR